MRREIDDMWLKLVNQWIKQYDLQKMYYETKINCLELQLQIERAKHINK